MCLDMSSAKAHHNPSELFLEFAEAMVLECMFSFSLKKHKHHQMQAKHLMTSSWYQLLIFAIRGWYCTRKYKSMKGTNRIRNLCNIKWKKEANPIPCLKNIKQISSRWNKDSFVFPILPFSMAFTFDQIRVS